MLVLDYNSAIQDQSEDIKRSQKKLDFFHTPFGKWFTPLFLDSIITKLTKLSTTRLLQSKGVLSEIRDNSHKLVDKDLSKVIRSTNDLLNLNITLHSMVIEVIGENKENEFQKLSILQEIIEETIETLYSINRVLKRSNLKTHSETSQLAIDSSRKSLDTLAKVICRQNG